MSGTDPAEREFGKVMARMRASDSKLCHMETVRERCNACGDDVDGETCDHSDPSTSFEEPCAAPATVSRVIDGIDIPLCDSCAEEYDEDPEEPMIFVPAGLAKPNDDERWMSLDDEGAS